MRVGATNEQTVITAYEYFKDSSNMVAWNRCEPQVTYQWDVLNLVIVILGA